MVTLVRWATFLSTLPARGATVTAIKKSEYMKISIHAPREGSDHGCLRIPGDANISIHAPREGSDRAARGESRLKAISIHAPREGSDLFRALGGGTQRHFYPRSPRGERLFIIIFFRRRRSYFYPRSPRGERPTLWILQISRTVFLSTLPARGATRRPRAAGPEQRISIHAPREGSDPKSGSQGSRSRNFYPRSPRGERP